MPTEQQETTRPAGTTDEERALRELAVRQVERVFAGWGVRRITVLIEVGRPWAMDFWTAVGYPRDDRIVRHVRALEQPKSMT